MILPAPATIPVKITGYADWQAKVYHAAIASGEIVECGHCGGLECFECDHTGYFENWDFEGETMIDWRFGISRAGYFRAVVDDLMALCCYTGHDFLDAVGQAIKQGIRP